MESSVTSAPYVGIFMITYNHENYIELAIESAMTQQCDFSYKLFIGEDCSTDRTREICIRLKQKYPDKIELILHEKNVGGALNAIIVFEKIISSGAKYIAMLDGDDYWIDELKLQKQVTTLDSKPDISLCFTGGNILNNDTKEVSSQVKKESDPVRDNFDTFVKRGFFYPTCTVLIRSSSLPTKFPDWFIDIIKQDWGIFLFALHYGDAYYLPEITAVYRKHSGGVIRRTKKIQLEENSISLLKHLRAYFEPQHSVILDHSLEWGYFHLAFMYWDELRFKTFFKYILLAASTGKKKTFTWYWYIIKKVAKDLLRKIYHKRK